MGKQNIKIIGGCLIEKNMDDYEKCIKYYYNRLNTIPPFHPEFEKINNKLSRQIGKWADLG